MSVPLTSVVMLPNQIALIQSPTHGLCLLQICRAP